MVDNRDALRDSSGVPDFQLHQHSPSDLKTQLDAERRGTPFLVYRTAHGEQLVRPLEDAGVKISVGRSAETDISLPWDGEVSRLHAELECVAGTWVVIDDGISRNGTYVNSERVHGRRRLRDHDMLRFGNTIVSYRYPTPSSRSTTRVSSAVVPAATLSEAQRRVLVALCRPFKEPQAFTTPPTNHEIATELFLSVGAVKTHIRTLFEKFGVEDLPQNRKRARLIELAFQAGAVSPDEL